MSESRELHEQGADRSRALVANGAPWRPYTDKGVLVAAAAAPRMAAEVFAVAQRSLMTHLEAACLWPETEQDRSWHLGDYAYYILSCKPATDAGVYVQCWSESGDEGRLLVEVSSGHGHAPSERYVDATRQALLRERGFEIGGNASNFRKRLVVADEINRRWSGLQASIDQHGDLVLETEVRLHGGVTLEHLRMRIDLFRRSVEALAEGRA